ncbi:MAG: chlorohydrolase family protein [Pikeienuella sp.]|uniref:chlorohydrolase family protein n=1 Tax=Pikeienuella sp. TaxID=2831957 RepID=UPI00391B6E1F
MRRTLLTADWLLAETGGRRRLMPRGEVVFEGGAVAFVGHGFPGEVAERLDFGPALISPGFVDLDALSDLDTTILGLDNGPGAAKGRVWPDSYVARGPYEMYSEAELAFQKRFAFAALIRAGITSALPIASLFYREWGETAGEFEAAADAAEALGLRVWLGPAYRTGGQVVNAAGEIRAVFDEARGLAGLDEAADFAKRIDGRAGGRIRAMFAPDRIETCTEALLTRTAALAAEMGAPVRQHCLQGATEIRLVRELHGCTPAEWLEKLGVLSPRWLLPHGTEATGRDFEIVRDAGAAIVHCPLVSARHGSALRSLRRLIDMGVKVGMGTDTWPPDMIHIMQLGLMLCRLAEGDALALRAGEIWDAATAGGADALGRPDLGRLAEGARADAIVIPLDDTLRVPDPIQTILAAGPRARVSDVFVEGRRIMAGGLIPGVDEAADMARAQAQFDGLIAKYPERTLGHPPVSAIFEPSFPVEPAP